MASRTTTITSGLVSDSAGEIYINHPYQLASVAVRSKAVILILLVHCLLFLLLYVFYVIWSFWLVGFVALRPKSTAMVIAGRSVHLTTFFPGHA